MADTEVIKAMTELKIDELRRHDGKLSQFYDRIETQLQEVRESPVEKLRALFEGVNGLQIVQEHVHKDLDGIPDLLTLGDVNAEILSDALRERAEQIEQEIKRRRSLWQHNKLLGQLLLESLEDLDDKKSSEALAEAVAHGDGEWEMDVEVSRASASIEQQRQEAQKKMEEYFFTPCGQQRDQVKHFLETWVFHQRERFSDVQWKNVEKTLENVRSEIKTFGESLLSKRRILRLDVSSLATSLLADKSEFSSEVVRLLENASQNSAVQDELAHVLTIQLSILREFQWPASGVPVVMKRAMNGRYRSLLQEGAIPFLLFQFLGLEWSKFIKRHLISLLKSVDLTRQNCKHKDSVDGTRINMRNRFMLTALPSAGTDWVDNYNETISSDTTKPTKQEILRLVCAEAHLANTLKGENGPPQSLLAVVTDLAFFGPSVSHEVVLGIMDFLGVSSDWLKIFETHMKMPIRFPGSYEPQPLAKGVPASRRASRFYSELLLFAMDFSVMATSGVFLYRTHDDILFFGYDKESVLSAWDEIHKVADAFGLRLNAEKSGSVCLNLEHNSEKSGFGPTPLPQQPIRWGLVELQSNATVQIMESKVQWFAWELAQKLTKTKSVLRWVTVYNKYIHFFLRNFGSVSPVFGEPHVDSMIQNIKTIHNIVFPETNGDVQKALRAKIEANHPELADRSLKMPAAWVYWPLERGGLSLYNPLVKLWSLKQALLTESGDGKKWRHPFDGVREKLRVFYDTFTGQVETLGLETAISTTFSTSADASVIITSSKPPVVRSFHEYLQELVKYKNSDLDEFDNLLEETDVSEHPSFKKANTLAKTVFENAPLADKLYLLWIAYIYHRELKQEFGTTALVSKELLPAQLISEIKKAGIYWS